MPKDNETIKQYRERMTNLCTEAFARHELHVVQPYDHEAGVGVYRCQRPDSWFYGFYVAFLPGGVISLYGDIAGIRIKPGHKRALGWLRGSWSNTSYLMEKAERVYREEREFFPAEVLPHIHEEEAAEYISTEVACKLRMAWSERHIWPVEEDLVPRYWGRMYYELTESDGEVNWTDWNADIYYAQHALGTFVRLYEASLEQSQEAA